MLPGLPYPSAVARNRKGMGRRVLYERNRYDGHLIDASDTRAFLFWVRSFGSGQIDGFTEDVFDRDGFFQLLRISVGFDDQAAIGKYLLGIGEHVPKIIEPVGVPIDVFHQPGKLAGKGIRRDFRRNEHPAM